MLLLNLLPAPLHRALYRWAHCARKVHWRIRRPSIDGVRVLALDDAGHVVLIRHSYGSDKWMPPGGGLRAGEDPVLAGARELVEETGLALCEGRVITVIEEDLHGASNRVHIVAGRTIGMPVPDGREIVEARRFAPDALPEHMPVFLRQALPGWLERARLQSSES